MTKFKIGATLQLLLEFTEEEFDAIYPNEEFLAEAEITGGAEYTLTPTIDVAARSILLSASTTGWTRGRYKCDIRVTKNGVVSFLPADSYIEFELISPVAEIASQVNT